MKIDNAPFLTTGELAEVLQVQGWRIARLFELKIVPEPSRVAGRRMIPRSQIPRIIDELRRRNWGPVNGEVIPDGS